MNVSVSHEEKKGEENVRVALVNLNVKPAYIENYVADIYSNDDMAEFAKMTRQAIQDDYQLYVECGGLE